MKLGRPSIHPSVCLSIGAIRPILHPRRAAGLLLSAVPAADIDNSDGRQALSSSMALSSKCEQCHVYS